MKKTACFTGHRALPLNITRLKEKLRNRIEALIADGVTDFYAGGAIGWDTLAAQIVLECRKTNAQVKLHLVLPCPFEEQSYSWTDKQKEVGLKMIEQADTVEYTSDRFHRSCMNIRNARLVEHATVACVGYLKPDKTRSGTGRTMQMAREKGLVVTNLYDGL